MITFGRLVFGILVAYEDDNTYTLDESIESCTEEKVESPNGSKYRMENKRDEN